MLYIYYIFAIFTAVTIFHLVKYNRGRENYKFLKVYLQMETSDLARYIVNITLLIYSFLATMLVLYAAVKIVGYLFFKIPYLLFKSF